MSPPRAQVEVAECFLVLAQSSLVSSELPKAEDEQILTVLTCGSNSW